MTPPAQPIFDPANKAVLFSQERQILVPRDTILAFSMVLPGMTVADCGCGNGYLLEHFSRAVGPTGQVLASDLQESMLVDARTLVTDQRLSNVILAVSGPETLPIPDGVCDRVILCHVWHDIVDREQWCREAARVLKSTGELVIVNWEPILTEPGPVVWRRWSMLQTTAFLSAQGWTVTRAASLTWAIYGVAARLSS